jgi:hypothetical protein
MPKRKGVLLQQLGFIYQILRRFPEGGAIKQMMTPARSIVASSMSNTADRPELPPHFGENFAL